MAIEDEVIKAIKKGKAKMRPRAYFVFRNLITILAAAILVLVLVYLVGFIIFVFQERGFGYATGFGLAGWYSFFASFPWIVILLIAIFFTFLAILARRYPFGYRWPIIYSLFGVILLVITANVLLAQTSFYGMLFNQENGFTGSGSILSLPITIPDNLTRGIVTAQTADGFILQDRYGTTSSVKISSETYLPTGPVQAGDFIVVLGDRTPSGTIAAVGVKRIPP